MRFYTGITSWNVFVHFFSPLHLIDVRTRSTGDQKLLIIIIDENHQYEVGQGRPRTLSVLDEFFSYCKIETCFSRRALLKNIEWVLKASVR